MKRNTTLIALFLLAAAACGDERGDGSRGDPGIGLGGLDSETGTVDDGGLDDGGDGGDDGGGDGGGPGGGGDDNCGGGEPFSVIWIANSPEGTVSKIDTRTGGELARYVASGIVPSGGLTGPSRTSVALNGDVAVVDRSGAISKFRGGACDENNNGTPGLQTSVGNNALAWGDDDCLEWSTPLPSKARPAAWTRGKPINNCEYEPADVWTAAPSGKTGHVYLLDGLTGDTVEDVAIPECDCGSLGPYGGAVDADNNFWTFTRYSDVLIRVDADDFSYEVHDIPAHKSYGIMVDGEGRPWIAGEGNDLRIFDPQMAQFITVPVGHLPTSSYVLRGLSQDADGRVWIAALNGWSGGNTSSGLLRIEQANGVYASTGFYGGDVLPGVSVPAGTSVDIDGKIWLVDQGASKAYRFDPDNATSTTVEGLVAPYTYSDMTGFGLSNAGSVPEG